MRQGQVGTGLVEDAAAVVGQSIRDRKLSEGHGRAAADVENPAGGIATDRQVVGAEALDV
jgi:hypothetical protein